MQRHGLKPFFASIRCQETALVKIDRFFPSSKTCHDATQARLSEEAQASLEA